MEQKLKTYKAFDKDLSCRWFKYEVGKEYEETGDIKACEKGFHACPYPLDVFGYYVPAGSRFCEVEQSGKIDDSESDKVCSSKIRIGAILVIAEEGEDTYDIVDWKAVLVDGEVVKADTWYRLENGELVEVD